LRRSLGWNSFSASAARYHNQLMISCRYHILALRQLRLPGHAPEASNFSKGARGRWCLNLRFRSRTCPNPPQGAIQRSVDIDLGLKDFAAPSDGEVITA
jgi:putative transposase